MGRNVDGMDQAIHALYDAALEPGRWPEALRTLAELADTAHAALLDTNFANGMVHRQHLHNISAEDQRLYLDHYAAIDPRMQFLGARRSQWFSDYETFDASFRASHPFYVEYFQPRHAGESLFSMFALEGPRIGTLGLVRQLDEPKADAALRHELDRLLPHLDRATRITRRFASLASQVVIARAILDQLDEPLCCVDDGGRVQRMNAAFSGKLREADVVTESRGRLQFNVQRTHNQVMRAVRECCHIAQAVYGRDSDARLTFSVARNSGSIAFITVAPLVAGAAQSWAGGACALLRIDEFNAQPSPERIEQALGLTAAEARLVSALCHGGTLAAVAGELGISPNTAKTHLAAAFGKTGTRRQSELIALISAMPR
jgi:DNA-binding CsgD family transcriptional regulator/PAS domain-containing protein